MAFKGLNNPPPPSGAIGIEAENPQKGEGRSPHQHRQDQLYIFIPAFPEDNPAPFLRLWSG